MNTTEIELKIPVELIKDDEYFVISFNDKTTSILGHQLHYGQGKTFEEAEKNLWQSFRCMIKYDEERSSELNRWKPFQKGDWKHIGGSWFTIFGIQVYFRHGDGMQGGKYIPFTKLNIMISNYWRKPKTRKK